MKMIKNIIILIIGCYAVIIIGLYFVQEKLLFHPSKLPKQFKFEFENEFVETDIEVGINTKINTVLFKAEKSKRVVLFFHGNSGMIKDWAQGANLYLTNGYDIMYIDYRGYGKSDGKINSERQLINDSQKVYDYLKEIYQEENIILSGTSIGSGIAAQIAINNKPKRLILNSPYSSLASLIKEKISIVPSIVIKYKLQTENYIQKIDFPVSIFHGDNDNLIPVHHARKLKELNSKIELYILEGYGHNDITQSPKFISTMNTILTY